MGASRAGGSDTSDERKQDSYSKQFRKNYTVNKKTGDVKKRNIVSRLIINSPTGTVVGDFADNHNYKRRLKFAEKNNLNLISKSKEYLMSPAAKSYLDEFGYADTLKDKTGINDKTRDRDSDNQNKPVIVQKNVGGKTVQTTETKVAEDKKEATKYDERVTKKKGKRKNILTSSQGITKLASDYSLSDKTLLGRVV